ncbi:hypothetical protein EVAR_67571_1 [Eumeta japonica]|uniref:Uncharacterized protein n=1 Tax=Eumeta variegata TaxID=151549 RepID=A0A4C1ZKF1_EUMVA|nr:hypothetical protein EVAR_67571_1 [Eumeta japonica]
MDVLREREVKDSLERQLLDEQKMRDGFLEEQTTCSFYAAINRRPRSMEPATSAYDVMVPLSRASCSAYLFDVFGPF